MNVFEIDSKLDEELEEIVIIQDLADEIEEGKLETIPEELREMLLEEATKAFSENLEVPLLTYDVWDDLEASYNILIDILKYKMNKLSEVEDDLFDKIDAYSYHVKQLQGDAEMAKDEATRFADKAKLALKKAGKRKEILMFILNKYGEVGKSGNRKVKTSKFNLWTTNRNSTVIDENQLSTEDEAHMTKISFKLPTKDALAFMSLVSENPEVLDSVNLDNIDISTLNNEISINKTIIGKRLKAGEVIDGANLNTNTSVTIR